MKKSPAARNRASDAQVVPAGTADGLDSLVANLRVVILDARKKALASKYRLVLPTEEELRAELIREQQRLADRMEAAPPPPRPKPARKTRKTKPGQP